MDNDGWTLVGGRAVDMQGGYIVPGSRVEGPCATCGEGVMVAPSGQRWLAEHPGARLLCSPCGVPEAIQQPDANIHVAAGVAQELRDWQERN